MDSVGFLLVSLAFTSAVLCIIFFVAWWTLGRQRHTLAWAVTFAVALLQWLFNLSKTSFAEHHVYWLTVSALGLGTIVLAAVGHLWRTQRDDLVVWLCGASLVCYALIAVVTLATHHVGLQMACQPLFSSAVLAGCCWVLYQHRSTPTYAEWGAILSTGSFALAQLAAGLIALNQGPAFNAELVNLYNLVNFLGMPAAYISTSMFMILVIASDVAEDLRQLAVKDALTGVYNRRGFYEAGERLFALSKRQQRPLSLIMTDIDHFKRFNDRFGHLAGDNAIHFFAQTLNAQRRREDVVARIGGEEFVLLLPGASGAAAQRVADQLAAAVRRTQVSVSNPEQRITASFGVASLGRHDIAFTQLLERADQALYQAKEDGRDCTVYAAPVSASSQPA